MNEILGISAMSAVGNMTALNPAAFNNMAELNSAQLATGAASNTPNSFATWFVQEVNDVNRQLVNADQDVARLATGQAVSLHEVMMHMEEAKLSFQLLAQVRNRLLDAYQEVMRMQV